MPPGIGKMGPVSGVLHVCTANRCRSVFAERVMRSAVPAQIPVTSAGTDAVPGQPIWPGAAEQLELRGISAYGFSSYPLTPDLVRGADLILTATRDHRDRLVARHPEAMRRTFTWRELAWLVDDLGQGDIPGEDAAERLRAIPSTIVARRGHLTPPPPHLFDVVDPVGRANGAMVTAADEIERALRPLLALL